MKPFTKPQAAIGALLAPYAILSLEAVLIHPDAAQNIWELWPIALPLIAGVSFIGLSDMRRMAKVLWSVSYLAVYPLVSFAIVAAIGGGLYMH